MVDAIAGSTPYGSTVDVATDPSDPNNDEPAMAISYYLAWRGRNDLETRLFPVYRSGADPAVVAEEGVKLANRFFQGRLESARSDCPNVSAVIVFVDEPRTRATLPCSEKFMTHTFVEHVEPNPDFGSWVAAVASPRTTGYVVLLR